MAVYFGYDPERNILIKPQLPMAYFTFRSISAAYCRQACRCLDVISGKSTVISAMLIPEACLPSTSYTLMRVPVMHGLPKRTLGLIEITSR